eukprot:g4139.t1
MAHTILIPDETTLRAKEYLESLTSGTSSAGEYFRSALGPAKMGNFTVTRLFKDLLNTKRPRIFAESEVRGDGSDWNLIELGLLGDISIAVPVTVYDDGKHTSPGVHHKPLAAHLVYTPGALLRNDRGYTPADWDQVTAPDRSFSPKGYDRLYERRLLPVFQYIDRTAAAAGKSAFITVPGLGCGCFAGPFSGSLGRHLEATLGRFLETHGAGFSHIRAVYFDPFNECVNSRSTFHDISLMTRPLLQGNQGKPQLCPPKHYEEAGDDFANCLLFSVVAWDHVSWPGNDFYDGSRATDDGVKAAATDSMYALTGIEGRYNAAHCAYLPPPGYRTWADVVARQNCRL